jgi:hypothetical protein
MDKRAKQKRGCVTMDISKLTLIESRVSPDPRGPARCIHCRQLFRQGEKWNRVTSPADPKFGTYSFGIHDRCSQILEVQAV